MNREELRKKVIEKYTGPGYSYVKKEDFDLELRVHDLLVDIMTSEPSANRLMAMFPNNWGLPSSCLDEDNVEEVLDFESITVHSDILDDGEFWILHDIKTGSWFLDRTYDFMDAAEVVCKSLGVEIENAEVGHFDGWRRHSYKDIDGTSMHILGLDDFEEVLKCVKNGDFSELNEKLPLKNLGVEIERCKI